MSGRTQRARLPAESMVLLAAAARTASITGATMRANLGPFQIADRQRMAPMQMGVYLDVTAAAAGTLDLTVQGSWDGTNWFTMTPREGAWTQVTTSPSRQYRTYHGPIPPFVRAVGTAASSL